MVYGCSLLNELENICVGSEIKELVSEEKVGSNSNSNSKDNIINNNSVEILASFTHPRLVGRLLRKKLEWRLEPSSSRAPGRRNAAAVADGLRYIYVMGGYDGNTALSTIERYDCAYKKWKTLKGELKSPVSGLTAAMLGNKIYTFGGFHGSRRQATCFSYDLKTEKCLELPKMIHKRGGCASVVLSKGAVCVIGGNDGLVHLNSAETLQIENGDKAKSGGIMKKGGSNNDNQIKATWSVLSDEMYEARSNFGAVAINDVIYVVGGENDNGVLRSVEKHSRGKWSKLPDMKLPRRYCAVSAIEHYLVVMGGDDGKDGDDNCVYDSCLVLNTLTDEWCDEATTMPCMNNCRGRASAVVIKSGGHRIHIMGGSDKNKRCLLSMETCDIFHTVPMPPAVNYPPEMITPNEVIINNNNGKKKDRMNDERLIRDSFALRKWLNQTTAAVNLYRVSIQTVLRQVEADHAWKENILKDSIEALKEQIRKTRIARNTFLSDLEKLTYPWFELQDGRLEIAKQQIPQPKRFENGGRTQSSRSKHSESDKTQNIQPIRVQSDKSQISQSKSEKTQKQQVKQQEKHNFNSYII